MAKRKQNNEWLAQQQAKKAAELQWHRLIAMQWAWDAAIIAAHRVFHRKGEIMCQFALELEKVTVEIANLTLTDSEQDEEMWYAKAKIDGQLKDILGEDQVVPYEERYAR